MGLIWLKRSADNAAVVVAYAISKEQNQIGDPPKGKSAEAAQF
jgi:hypothetical protein